MTKCPQRNSARSSTPFGFKPKMLGIFYNGSTSRKGGVKGSSKTLKIIQTQMLNGSMYGLYTYIYHKFRPNVGKYIIHWASGKERSIEQWLKLWLIGLYTTYIFVLYRNESTWLATPKRWRFVRGRDKTIHGSCAIYFPGGIYVIAQ